MAEELRELVQREKLRIYVEVGETEARRARDYWERRLFPHLKEKAKDLWIEETLRFTENDEYVKAMIVILLEHHFEIVGITWYKEETWEVDGASGGTSFSEVKISWK
jgi:hypothetical protein